MDASGGTRVRCAIAILAFALLGSAAADAAVLVGVRSVRFSWAPASGNPQHYLVMVSRNNGELTPYRWVATTSVDIPVVAGEKIAIAVRARRSSNGTVSFGPVSPRSEDVRILPAPTFPKPGRLTLHCSTCRSVSTRSLTDASTVLNQAIAPPPPWQIVGSARVRPGRRALVWQNPNTGDLDLWDADDLVPIPGGASQYGLLGGRFVGAADIDRDGLEELVFYHEAPNVVVVWKLTSARLERIAFFRGVPGAQLAAVGDFTGEGDVDLLWSRSGIVQMWSIVGTLSGAWADSAISPGPYVISGLPASARVETAADFDADGHLDLLWRFPLGRWYISYLVDGRQVGLEAVARPPDQEPRRVVGALDLSGTAGAELVLQSELTGEIVVAEPQPSSESFQGTRVLTAGTDWRAVDVDR